MKLKNITAATAVAAMLVANTAAYAAKTEYGDYAVVTGGNASLSAAADPGLSYNAAAVILIDNATGQILYEKNADQQRAIASITKVMTLILVMDALESGKITLQDKVTASVHAYETGGAQIWLEPGEIMTVDELMRAVCVASANDAAVALAEYVDGSEPVFVSMMNEKALKLGMTKTTFKNCNGLDEPGHLSCARDVALMSREILRHELIRNYITIWQDELRGGETELTNTNKLLKRYNGITGIKTGTTDDAGVCISASAMRDGMELIAFVLGSPSGAERFDAATTLLDYGFANFELADLSKTVEVTKPKIAFGEKDTLDISCDVPQKIIVGKGKAELVSAESDIREKIDAPVKTGDSVGEVRIYCDGLLILSVPAVAAEDVMRISFSSSLKALLKELIKM